jgi:hypothetical protein
VNRTEELLAVEQRLESIVRNLDVVRDRLARTWRDEDLFAALDQAEGDASELLAAAREQIDAHEHEDPFARPHDEHGQEGPA